MIYTVTFNPSIDYIVSVDDFTLGETNRTVKEFMFPGGKGINVSLVLMNLGIESTATGFMAGFTGKEISRLLKERNVDSDFIEVSSGLSRINVKLRSNEESEINGMGPAIGSDDIERLYKKLDVLSEGDYLILAGSIPTVMPASSYMDIMKRLEGRDIRIVVDATGDLLMNVLPLHPFFIKPNIKELEEIFDTEIKGEEEIIHYAGILKERGARNVMVSMAGEGALLLTENGKVYSSLPPEGKVKNSVGAGDSMVAGFLSGVINHDDYEKAFYIGLCAGSASAFSDEMAKKEDIRALLKQFNREGYI